MEFKMRVKVLFMGAALTVFVAPNMVLATSQPKAGAQPTFIVIEGHKRVEPETILSYAGLDEDEIPTPEELRRALKTLFATGLFADVAMEQRGEQVVIQVEENPIVSQVAFEGNKEVNDDFLKKEVKIRPRTVLTRQKVQDEVQRILAIYRAKGYFGAFVEPKVINLPENRIDLVFEITEGPSSKIQEIFFIGNHAFSSYRLEGAIESRPSRWYRFWSNADVYDPDRISYDGEKLRRFYLNHGYADFRLISATGELTPQQDGFYVTFALYEGEVYHVGDIEVTSEIPHVDLAALKNVLRMEKGDVYSVDALEKATVALTEELGAQGYAFVNVQPMPEKDDAGKVINIKFDIQESPKVFIRNITIVGNTRTIDSVVRREIIPAEGDAFNVSLVKESKRRLEDLRYFKEADIKHIPTDEADKTDLEVKVEEQSTGELNFGGGYATLDGPLGQVGYVERNLMGRGYGASTTFTYAKRRVSLVAGLSDPYFLNRDLAAGVNFAHTRVNREAESSFSARGTGGSVWMQYDITPLLSQRLKYSLDFARIGEIKGNASPLIREQVGAFTTSEVGQTLTYDRRDFKMDPTAGYVVSLTNDFAGVGGSVHYLRNVLTAAHYYSLMDQVILTVQGEVGYMTGLGRRVRTLDRFQLGGQSFRGFESWGIGPRATAGGRDSLGGMQYYKTDAEVTYPIPLGEGFDFKGHLFVEAGSLWDAQKKKSADFQDSTSLRVSTGLGFSWMLPAIGRLRIDFSKAVRKETWDKQEVFLLNVGRNL